MALELSLLPETLPEDVEDVSWGLQTAAALWNRGDRAESVVWVRRAAEAARGAGQEGRAVMLLRSAGDLESLLTVPPSSVNPADEPLRVLPPVGAPAPAPPALVPAATQEIEDFESLDPEAAEDLFAEEETHDLKPGDPVPDAVLPAAGRPAASSTPVAFAAPALYAASHAPPPSQGPPPSHAPPPTPPMPGVVPRQPASESSPASAGPHAMTSAPTPPLSVASASAPGPATPLPSSSGAAVIITTKPDSPPAGRAASNKKRQREPILDPWSDDMPPSDPPPRTQHHRPDLPSDDDDVMTSAPVLDVSLKRKPPPPPPKQRSQTLTGQPIPSGTVLAPTPTDSSAGVDSVRPKPESPVPPIAEAGPRPHPPPPPTTRKPTTPSMQAVSFPSAAPAQRERKSVPPPPPMRAPVSTGTVVMDAVTAAPAPSAEVAPGPAAPPPVEAPPAALAEVKSEPPPPTMPAAQQRASHPDDLLAALDLPIESLPKEPYTDAEPPPPPQPLAPPAAPAPAARGQTSPAPASPTTVRAASAPPPPRAPSRPPPPRAASVPPPPPHPASAPPPRLPSAPPLAQSAPPATNPRTSTIPPAMRSLAGLSLEQVEIFSDLSGEIQKLLCDDAAVVELNIEEEVAVTGAAIVLSGSAAVCPTVADAVASHLSQAALVPGLSSLQDPTRIRIVATAPATIASWDRLQLESALKSCPWVLEDLQRLGDRLSALAGATMGALGDLDEGSRLAAFERLTLRVLAPAEVLVAAGGELGGLNVVGGGAIIVAKLDSSIEFSVGDVVLPETVLEGGTTAGEVRAGPGGALLLTASRMVTVELFSILPSLIELLR